jgi:glycosyltransferase involved in cell wall biosynthesis
MRYAWHMRDSYFGRGPKALLVQPLLEQLRRWDRRSADRVTHFVAISQTVRQRIRECYDRPSDVIYPPVDTDFYFPAPVQREDYYLAVSAFAPYKRLDLAIAACNRLRKHLVVIGTGQDLRRLQAQAGPMVHFLGWQPDAVIRDHFCRCRALLFPGEEDFGIVPVEAQACGAPVIAFGKGGATETVIPLPGVRSQGPGVRGQGSGVRSQNCGEATGVWFEEQTVDGLTEAIEKFEACQNDFDPSVARRQALRFNHHRFARELFTYLDAVLERRPAGKSKAA